MLLPKKNGAGVKQIAGKWALNNAPQGAGWILLTLRLFLEIIAL